MVVGVAERLVDPSKPDGDGGEPLDDHGDAGGGIMACVVAEPGQAAVGVGEGSGERRGVPEQFSEPGDNRGEIGGLQAVVAHRLNGVVDGDSSGVEQPARRSGTPGEAPEVAPGATLGTRCWCWCAHDGDPL